MGNWWSGTTGVPEKHGFDLFFGYYDQVHAHTFYPSYLIRNSEEVPLPGNSGTSFYEGKTHAQLEIFKESIAFIQKHKDEPFFSVIFPGHPLMDCGASMRMILHGSFSKTNHGLPASARITMRKSMRLLCIWWIDNLEKSSNY